MKRVSSTAITSALLIFAAAFTFSGGSARAELPSPRPAGPWSDVHELLSSAAPGSVVELPAGAFDFDLVVEVRGNETHPVTVVGQGSKTVFPSAWVVGQFVSLENVTIRTPYGRKVSGVRVRDSLNVTLKNLVVSGGAGSGVVIGRNCTNVTVTGCEVFDRNALEVWYWNAYAYFAMGEVSVLAFVWLVRKRKSVGRKRSLALGLAFAFFVAASLHVNPEGYPFNYHPGLDAHGIAVTGGASSVWIVGNEAWGCSGDALQVINPPSGDVPVARDVHVVNNTFYGCRENAIDVKDADGVYVHHNDLQGSRVSPTYDNGVVVVFHFSYSLVEFHHNRVSHGVVGLSVATLTRGTGFVRGFPSWGIRVFNNTFWDINQERTPFAFTTTAAVALRNVKDVEVVGNRWGDDVTNWLLVRNVSDSELSEAWNVEEASLGDAAPPARGLYPQVQEWLLVSGEMAMLYLGVPGLAACLFVLARSLRQRPGVRGLRR
ncbi:MAG: hypothetical protein Kow0069_28200 [Promethearchaeota archaeon]